MITATALVLLMIPGVGSVNQTFCKVPVLTVFKFLLLGIGTEKVCIIATMAIRHGNRGHLLPVVLLGLFIGLLTQGWKVHWSTG
jgi:hypothetical protein